MATQNNSKHTNQGNSFLSEWLLPLIFLFAIPPVGVLLIVAKLFFVNNAPKKKPQSTKTPPPPQKVGARTTVGHAERESVKRKVTDPTAPMAKRAKKLTTWGGVLAILFGFVSLITLVDSLWVLPDVLLLLNEVLTPLCFTIVGGAMWMVGARQKKKLRRFRQYLSTIGRRQTITISSLSSATGRSPSQVREDLQEMLDDGVFLEGFLDYGGDMLVLSADGVQEPVKTADPKPSAADAENAVLAEIRAINDAIANESLSAQIDRIGVITAKIFDYQKAPPEKSPQLHSFLSYYLPTTLKILRAYAQLESQGIEGENISAAKQRIEQMMSKVVEGFEKQLDQLFQGDALDITSDVKVLEQMLAKDGLSSGHTIQLEL